jgi:hypothetical protein
MAKLSGRAIEILMVIRQRTGEDGSFWLPGNTCVTDDWCNELGHWVNINGGGDAVILRSLRDRKLIERPRGTTMPTEYAYRITEDGCVALERAREAGRFSPLIDKYNKIRSRGF